MRVAAKGKRLSRRMLGRCTVLFTVDTIIGWYNKLIAEKYDGSRNRTKVGRPSITEEIVNLVIKFKEENPRWGYKKIRGQTHWRHTGNTLKNYAKKTLGGIFGLILDLFGTESNRKCL